MEIKLKSRSHVMNHNKILCIPNNYTAVFAIDIHSL